MSENVGYTLCMPFRWNLREHLSLAWYVVKWVMLAAPVAVVVGSACALFLKSLDWATRTQWAHPWLLYLLPVAGVVMVLMYQYIGKGTEAGNNLIMDEIHEPGNGVPRRMAPLILISTVMTHLFGGSAGREGTAVQMGGSIASGIGKLLHVSPTDLRKLLMAGMAAGFAGVFGTPLAGAIFALEVLAIGRMNYQALFPCLVAGIVGDWACTAWGVQHTQYHIAIGASAFDWITASKVAIAAIAFGLVSVLFAELTHGLSKLWKMLLKREYLRPIFGGLLIIALTYLVGTRDYLGLGVETADKSGVSIVNSFAPGGAYTFSWFWKIIFTAITLSCGFKGGEVTPLFFIGATLGNVVGGAMGAPIDLFAGLGFVAVFAGATNTPLACTLMGIELFGSGHVVYIAIACFVAYVFSGHNSIYLSQRIGTQKGMLPGIYEGTTIRAHRD